MLKSQILYDNILSLLSKIIEDQETENYYESLDDNKKSDFIQWLENLQKEVDELRQCKITKRFYKNYDRLSTLINSFIVDFVDYPDFRYDDLKLIILFSQKIAELEDEITDEEIDIEIFTIGEFDKCEVKTNYFYFNSDPKKVLFLLNIMDLKKLQTFLSETVFLSSFLFQILSLFGNANKTGKKLQLITHKENFTKIKDLTAVLKIHLISNGVVLYDPFNYSLPPQNNYLDMIKVGDNYQQFFDIITILSEYNNQEDILDKYLRMYQVLENFMFRLPLVNLEALAEGKAFRIRDFRLMYERIGKSESNALGDLISESLKLKNNKGILLKRVLLNQWTGLNKNPGFDMVEINEFLKNLRIKIGRNDTIAQFSNINYDNFESFFKQLVYYIRNAIVHNKETEFHITHNVLKKSTSILFSDFLIPTTEEVVFNLISIKNQLVWYEKSKLLLWEE